jgi:hypothetical protein
MLLLKYFDSFLVLYHLNYYVYHVWIRLEYFKQIQILDFHGGKVAFIAEMRFLAESPSERISCYRVLDDDGQTISGSRFKEVLIFLPRY